jgi:hypothetical protein
MLQIQVGWQAGDTLSRVCAVHVLYTKLLCDLSGFKTLTTDSLSIIEDLGYTCLNTINDSLITRNSLI